MTRIVLPVAGGRLETFSVEGGMPFPERATIGFNRIALAAAHVVADPMKTANPWLDTAIDWDATIAYRRYLWDLGFGVAEAMDTAQRGMGLEWPDAVDLIRLSVEAARDVPGAVIYAGAGTDHLDARPGLRIDDVIAAYELQCEAIEAVGSRVILMASRALAAVARSAGDYRRVYGRVLRQVREPVIIHWLGEMFDPALTGYWGAADHEAAMETALAVIAENAAKIDGVKISLLDKDKEIAMRRRLPPDVRMYTGDDFNYAELIAGDNQGYSDALLGIFDAIAPAASAALDALAAGNRDRFHALLAPTVPLSRHMFMAPTRFYKTGVVFIAWINGHQEHFTMLGGQQSARSILHLSELFRLAAAAGLVREPERAVRRMKHLLALHGVNG